MIRVLIVEDSAVERELLIKVLSSDSQIQIVGIVGDGEAAIRGVEQLKPDVVTMDIHMPKMDGIEATRQIMQKSPVPIIIVTNSYAPENNYHSFQAIEAGALTIVKKPVGLRHPNHVKEAAILISYIKMMSEIKVIRRNKPIPATVVAVNEIERMENDFENIKVIAIGASTGGPAVLTRILSGLPKDLPVPLLIVQHISNGFLIGFVKWLISVTDFPIIIAAHGEVLKPGVAYFAPDDYHLTVGYDGRIILTKEIAKNGLRPSVAKLFESVAKVYGEASMGILLTGMGSDGALELKLMRDKGALTVAQDNESCVVFGMPGEAVKLGAAKYVLEPDRIIQLICKLKK